MKLYTHLILAVAALFLVAACSSDSSTTATTTVTTESGATLNLDGSWDWPCASTGLGGSDISTDTFTGAAFAFSEKGYINTDSTCSTASFYSENFGGTFAIVGTTTATFGAGTVTANQATFTVTSLNTTPNDAAMAA